MITPVILCGGSGTRLWPLSRTAYPKQLLALANEKSLLQQTLLRLRELPGLNAPVVICNQDYRFLIAEQVREIGIENAKIILEPEGKNTAPAVTIAALSEPDPEALLLVLPADHVINDELPFIKAVAKAAKMALQGTLVTFGVVPTRPETGYGYIQKGEAINAEVFKAKRFVEKPDFVTAQKYLESGEYFWNSGMFMFESATYLREMEEHAPDILSVCRDCVESLQVDLDFQRIKPELFAPCRSESIDYALMEKTKNIAVVPLDSDWSDVGSWAAMWDINSLDRANNVVKGDVVLDKVSNSYLHSESRLLAVIGLSDLVVVETADAVLVAHKDHSQDVKKMVGQLKSQGRSEVERHLRDHRPWGYFEVLNNGTCFQAKRLVVKPGAKLSLQMHHHRSEHWVVIKGKALVTCGEEQFILQENESTFIPAGTKHRLENTTEELLELIEVQTGSYFGEDDIVRFEDIYQRSLV